MEKINVLKGMFNNGVFISVIGTTLLFQVIIVECLGTFASTTPLSSNLWLISIGIGFVGMPIAVILKMIPV